MGQVTISVNGTVRAEAPLTRFAICVNGVEVATERRGETFSASIVLPFEIHYRLHSRWRGPYGSIVTARVEDAAGGCVARYVVVGGVG